MDEVKMIYEAINKLWGLIKKYNNKFGDANMCAEALTEAENIKVDDPEIQDMLQDWIVRWINYEDWRVRK